MQAPLTALRSLVYAALVSVTAGASAAQTADRTGAGANMEGKSGRSPRSRAGALAPAFWGTRFARLRRCAGTSA